MFEFIQRLNHLIYKIRSHLKNRKRWHLCWWRLIDKNYVGDRVGLFYKLWFMMKCTLHLYPIYPVGAIYRVETHRIDLSDKIFYTKIYFSWFPKYNFYRALMTTYNMNHMIWTVKNTRTKILIVTLIVSI